MRTRSIVTILGATALFMVALVLLWALRPPSIAIGTLSCEPRAGKGPSLCVRVGITNTGHKTIIYNQLNFAGDASLRVESRNGWAIRDIGPGGVFPSMPALLRPGSDTSAFILLPEGTVRWQVCYKVRAACLRDCVLSRIPAKWHSRLRPLCERFLSDNEGLKQEILSGVFECPNNVPPPVDGGMPLLFGSDALWPAATEAER